MQTLVFLDKNSQRRGRRGQTGLNAAEKPSGRGRTHDAGPGQLLLVVPLPPRRQVVEAVQVLQQAAQQRHGARLLHEPRVLAEQEDDGDHQLWKEHAYGEREVTKLRLHGRVCPTDQSTSPLCHMLVRHRRGAALCTLPRILSPLVLREAQAPSDKNTFQNHCFNTEVVLAGIFYPEKNVFTTNSPAEKISR